jgi:hypothetical protein
MALIPLAIFILFSFTKEIKLNWTGPLWLAVTLLYIFAFCFSDRCCSSMRTWFGAESSDKIGNDNSFLQPDVESRIDKKIFNR